MRAGPPTPTPGRQARAPGSPKLCPARHTAPAHPARARAPGGRACVLAMQMGSPAKPMRVYSSICFSACGRYSTLPALYVCFAMTSIFSCVQKRK